MNKYLGNSLDTILSSFLCRNYDSKNKFDHEIRDNSDSTITFETENLGRVSLMLNLCGL